MPRRGRTPRLGIFVWVGNQRGGRAQLAPTRSDRTFFVGASGARPARQGCRALHERRKDAAPYANSMEIRPITPKVRMTETP